MNSDTKTFLQKLDKIFSRKTVLRHKSLSGSSKTRPLVKMTYSSVGKSKGFTKFANYLQQHGMQNRMAQRRLLYSTYDQMENSPEIAAALDICADEITAVDEQNEMIQVTCDDEDKKKVIESLLYDILNLNFNLWAWTRNLLKYGDFGLLLQFDEEHGVYSFTTVPAWLFDRNEGTNRDTPDKVTFSITGLGEYETYNFIHFRLLNDIKYLPYGRSYLEPARVIWKHLVTLEDSMLVYRITRAPERRIYFIDVGEIPPDEVENYMNTVKMQIKSDINVDITTGNIDYRFTSLNPIEDYFIPTTSEKTSTRIETLPGGSNEGIVEEVTYLQSKLFAALKVPKSYLSFEEDLSGKGSLSNEDIRFAKTVHRMQQSIIAELKKVVLIHLFCLGYEGKELVDYELKLANPSTVSEKLKLELVKEKVDTFNQAIQGGLSRKWGYEYIWKISEDEVETMYKELIKDAKFTSRLQKIMQEGVDPEEAHQVDQNMQSNKFGGNGQGTLDHETENMSNSNIDYPEEDELSNPYGDKRVTEPGKIISASLIRKYGNKNRKRNTIKQLNESFELQLTKLLKSLERSDINEKIKKKNKHKEVLAETQQ